MTYRFRTSIPPSNNTYKKYYCTGEIAENGAHIVRAKVTDRAEAYREEAGWRAKDAGVRVYDGDVRVVIHAYQIQNGRPVDLDNLPKTVFDALNHIAYHDDKQVADYQVIRHWVKRRPHLIIEITNIESEAVNGVQSTGEIQDNRPQTRRVSGYPAK